MGLRDISQAFFKAWPLDFFLTVPFWGCFLVLELVAPVKACTKCGEVKSFGEFSRDSCRRSGLSSACLVCRRGQKRLWRARRAQEGTLGLLGRTRPTGRTVALRAFRAAAREERRAFRELRAFFDDILERPRFESGLKFCTGKYSLCGELKPLSAFENCGGGKLASYCKECGNRTRRQKLLLREHRRRARLAGASGCRSVEQTRARFEFFGNRCAYCGSAGPLDVEHVIPLSRGGSEWPANIRPACKPCNAAKGSLKLGEWREAA